MSEVQSGDVRAATISLSSRSRTWVSPVRHRWLDPWLIPSGPALALVVATVTQAAEAHQAATGARRRALSVHERITLRALVDLLVANLALAVLDPPPSGALAVRVGHVAEACPRYEHPAIGSRHLRPLLVSLHEAGLAVLDVSMRRGEVSSLAPSAAFTDLMRDSGATVVDLRRNADEEVILLHRKLTPREDPSRRERLDYRDTATVRTMRGDLRRINAALAAADVAFTADHPAPSANLSDRRMTRRFFVGPEQRARFDQGGRLFGGFWQILPAVHRHLLRIDGEPVVDLDFQAMHVRLAYGHLGKVPPAGDLYALPGLEGHRRGVKLAINTLFWDVNSARKTWPRNMDGQDGHGGATADAISGLRMPVGALLPPEWDSVPRLRKALLERHPGLQDAFGKALGATLMFQESEIMVAVLLDLIGRGVVALPLHDGLMVPRSRMTEAKAVMENVGKMLAGVELPVVLKGLAPPAPITRLLAEAG